LLPRSRKDFALLHFIAFARSSLGERYGRSTHFREPQRIRVFPSSPAFAAIASALLVAAALFAQGARAGDLVVRYDQSQLIRLPRPAAEVIIGNPSIADVAIQGGNLLAVTGKSFGVTNIIALDAQRNVIQDQRIVVERDSASNLVLYKGTQRETYSCNPTCAPTLSIGDEKTYFDLIAKHSNSKMTSATGNAERNTQATSE
jgi:hypothetical protein